jgi:hypothetical protein
VTADGVDDWSIDGMAFENVSFARIDSGLVTEVSSVGNIDSCIHARNCKRWSVRNCRFTKYSCGLLFWGSESFRIINNNFEADSGKTLSQIKDGTYTAYTSGNFNASCAIGIAWEGGGPAPVSSNYEISGNIIYNAGLRVGIESLAQFYDRAPCIVSNNTIVGSNFGIRAAYRGSFTDAGGAPTYETGVLVQGNKIEFTWEGGIYVRGVVGVQVIANRMNRTGMGGTLNSSSCGIVLRVNPFAPNLSATFTSAANLGDDYPNVVAHNAITNHGRVDGNNDPDILVELNNTLVVNNAITRSKEFSTTMHPSKGAAIQGGNGKFINRLCIAGNEIRGVYLGGIQYFDSVRSASFDSSLVVRDNRLSGTFAQGINLNFLNFGVVCESNIVTQEGVATASASAFGIALRAAPYGRIINNRVSGFVRGIDIQDGCLASDVPRFLSAGAITFTNLRGGTVSVLGNDIDTPPNAVFTGDISGTTLTVSSVESGAIRLGMRLTSAAGISANTSVSALVTGNGGAGTYTVSVSQTVASTVITGSSDAFYASNTSATEATPDGRVSLFRDNRVNGSPFVFAYANGTPPSTFTAKIYNLGDVVANSSLTAGANERRVCVSAGQYGSSATATGDTTAGSPLITNVSSLDGWGPSLYLTATGFTGPAKIVSVDVANDTITVDQRAASTNSATTLSSPSPVFAVAGYSQLSGSATYDPPNLIDGAGATTTVTVTGAALGDYAEASFSLDLQGITLTAWVSAADTVSVRFQNETGGTIDLGSGTLRARVFKP